MKLWIAHWLRKLAHRIDGERYVHAPKGFAVPDSLLKEATPLWYDLLMTGNAYIQDGKRVPPEDVVRDTRTGRFHVRKPPLTQEPSPWYAREFLGFDPEPRCIGGLLDAPDHAQKCPAHKPTPRLPDPFRHDERPYG